MFWLKDRTVLICANANPRIGTRHVRRCAVLAKAVSRFGFESVFLTPRLPVSMARSLSQFAGHRVLSPSEDLSAVVADINPAWLVSAGAEDWLSNIDTSERRILRLDDPFCQPFSELIHGGYSDRLDEPRYGFSCEPECEELALKARVKRIAWIVDDSCDHADLCKGLLEHMQANRRKCYSVDLISPTGSRVRELESTIAELGHSVRVHGNIDRLEPVVKLSDVAVVSNIHWLADLSQQNVPTVYLAGDGKDDAVVFAGGIADHGAIELVHASCGASSAAKQIGRFFGDVGLRRERCQNSYKLFDENGAERLARSVAAAMFQFRDCTIEDGERLLAWRNDPESRAVCFDSECIEAEDHFRWLQQQIVSDFCEIFVVENSLGKPVGQIRLEYDQQHATARLNVGLVPSLRGMGLGTAMIERACRIAMARRPNLEVYANIRTNNVISQAAFRKAGFSPDATLMVNDNVAVRFSIRRFDVHRGESDFQYRKAS